MPLPSEEVLAELVARYAHVLAAAGDAFEGAELVTPTAAHFPDQFSRDGKSLARLLARVVSYTPLGEDVPLEIGLLEDEGDDGHCQTGCSKPAARDVTNLGVQRMRTASGYGYRLPLPMSEISNPTRLVCALARGVSGAVIVEGELDVADDIGVASEIVATAAGFGVVLLEGSHVYTKSCGGPSIHRGTALGTGELAFLLATFCAITDRPARAARKHLGATQAETFDEAAAFVAEQDSIVRKLREAPELLERGAFAFESKRGIFSRLFSSSRAPAPTSSKRTRDPEEERRLAEARALVEEELELG